MRRSALLLACALAACGQDAKAPPAQPGTPAPEAAKPSTPLFGAGSDAATATPAVLVWVETDPLQCKNNAWEKWDGLGGMPGFFASKGVKVYSEQQRSFNLLFGKEVPLAKDCQSPAGHALYLQVAEKDLSTMQSLGFKRATVDPLNADSYYKSRAGLVPSAPGTSAAPAQTPARKKKTTTKKRRRRTQ